MTEQTWRISDNNVDNVRHWQAQRQAKEADAQWKNINLEQLDDLIAANYNDRALAIQVLMDHGQLQSPFSYYRMIRIS